MFEVLLTGDQGQPIRVMVLDDEPAIGLAMKRNKSFEVEMADEPANALARLEAGRIRCDVWVVDIDLKAELTGFHVLDRLRRIIPGTPVIMLSGYSQGDYVRKSWRMGAFDYLIKPIATGALVDVIRQAHARSYRPEISGLVGKSPAMLALQQQIQQFAEQPSSVLICGETGTGKELVARALHLASERRQSPFIAINCGALAPELVDSELFGHVRGAFTGALADRPGLLAEANHGTLFLDEIGDMPLQLQTKLLRALQEHEVRAVGTNTVRSIDVRVISATHVDLWKAIMAGRFREDLFYRLNVLPLTVPALRDRMEDVPMLAEAFMLKHARGRQLRLHPSAVERLLSSRWPGNVRQLENAVQRACALCMGDEILPEHLPSDIETMREAMRRDIETMRAKAAARAQSDDDEGVKTLRAARQDMNSDFMVKYLRKVMMLANGVVAEAARMAGLDRANFRRLLRKYKIDPREFRVPGRAASKAAEGSLDEDGDNGDN